MGKTYTFVGLSADGRSPFVDIRVFENGEDPAIHARGVLDEHRSCARIEVWDGHVRLFTVGRDLADTGEVAPR
ncbi:hypothetical protein ASD38_08320 [Caulobacter sp. Root487D2Y]|uniref:hypothetical protein n=1 Tax=Caulobacter sp. Root487D2Y TaxID=1736547 RepID=UPI0006F8FB5C|nr:hypothetical protein [Caulobacter sp. Root487D2Y]KQY29351.1 hypothetical protein ASD38_08320 [Caulobacter sp. Root487D2Y]